MASTNDDVRKPPDGDNHPGEYLRMDLDIALRQLREPDAFPAADVGLMRALADLEGRRRSSRELVGRADQWRPWRAYAAQHLWASI